MLKYAGFLVASFSLNAASYVFYKYSSINSAKKNLSLVLLVCGLLIGAMNAFFYTKSLKGINLNIAYPVFSAFSIILVSVISIVLFREGINIQKIIGICVIVSGVIIITL